jgi:hypothetical protein
MSDLRKFFLCLIALASPIILSARCSEIPETIRRSYASDFYQAFVLQSQGKSTSAFCQFQTAYETAKKAGESIQRLTIIEQLFGWYRMYGASSGLFYHNPTGHDRIVGEHKRRIVRSLDYTSECGKTPEQAALIREFMFGAGEAISGVFCVTLSGGVASFLGGSALFIDGCTRMGLILNNLWAQHERAVIDLKKWEERSKKTLGSD